MVIYVRFAGVLNHYLADTLKAQIDKMAYLAEGRFI
jgi:hypothetical protein